MEAVGQAGHSGMVSGESEGARAQAPSAPVPALLLDDVVKTYGPIRAVDGVSLRAEAGQFIALLGPNGAGKSTLFQLLSGLFTADSGRIEGMVHDMCRDPGPALDG